MAIQLSTTDRNSVLSALVTALGGSATMKFYSGARPTPAAWSSGAASLATLTFGSTAVTDTGGSVTNGVLTFGTYSQTAASHTAGTPTWVALVTSGARCVATIDIGSGAGNIQFSGSIVNGQNITGTMTLTAPHA